MLTSVARSDLQSVPKSLVAFGAAYFLYEIGLQYLGPALTLGTGVFSSPEGATILRTANTLALGFLLLAAWFVFVAAVSLRRLATLVAAMFVARATFLTIWFTPSSAAAWLTEVVVPLLLLGSLFVLSVKVRQSSTSAP
ncbi:MAG: hypothetical protein AB7F38_00050 [Piscinibacter sp.]